MAWTTSKVFARTVYSQITGGHNFNWSTDSLKVALYISTTTPDANVTTDVLTTYNGLASQWVTANEVVTGSGYTAGGVAVTPLGVTQATSNVKFTSSGTPQWTASTITDATGCLVYDTTISNLGLSFNWFGGSNTVTSGTFTMVWNASGIVVFAS